MKKILSVLAVLVLSAGSTLAMFTPSIELSKKVDAVSQALIQIVDQQYDGNYEILIPVLNKFKAKVAGNEKKEWVLETIEEAVQDKIKEKMMMKDDMIKDDMMKDDMMKDDMMKDDMMKDEMMKDDMMKDDMMKDEMMKDEMMKDEMMDKHDDKMMKESVALEHVAEGKTIRGVSFDGTETGMGHLAEKNDNTIVHASFEGLANPGPDNFYEGWIVRTSPLSVISTGELIVKDGMYVNHYEADGMLDGHTFYVLTLEPNDNDPAPADHVFEGNL